MTLFFSSGFMRPFSSAAGMSGKRFRMVPISSVTLAMGMPSPGSIIGQMT